jgi:hypothetical protein
VISLVLDLQIGQIAGLADVLTPAANLLVGKNDVTRLLRNVCPGNALKNRS